MSSPQELADCRLIVPGIEKGSQGKSTIMACIVEWLRHRYPKVPINVYDPDHLHMSLYRAFGPSGGSRFRPDEPHRIERLTIKGEKDLAKLDTVIDNLIDAPSSVSVLDGVAQGFEELFGVWSRTFDFARVQEDLSFRVLYVLPVTSEPSTIAQAVQTMQSRGNTADYLIVKRVSRTGGITPWDMPANMAAREVAESVGARSVSIHEFFQTDFVGLNQPEPNDRDELPNSPKNTIASLARDKRIKYMDQAHASQTWAEIISALDQVADVILPPALAAAQKADTEAEKSPATAKKKGEGK
jgi:hypothetical protein